MNALKSHSDISPAAARPALRWLVLSVASATVFLASCSLEPDWSYDAKDSELKSDSTALFLPEDKVQLDLDVLEKQGVAPLQTHKGGDASSMEKDGKLIRGAFILRPNTRLVAILDNTCVDRQADGVAKRIRNEAGTEAALTYQAYAFKTDEAMTLDQLVREADADDCVLQVGNEVDVKIKRLPNDPSYGSQWQLSRIEAAASYDTFYDADGIKDDVTIAIVDSGVNYNHPDLKANMWRAGDGTYGYDFENDDSNPLDDNGHGTHCAGLAAAVTDNSIGVAGTMGKRAKIMAVKVLSAEGAGTTSSIVNGIAWAVEHGAQVVSLSLGHEGPSSVMATAIRNAVAKGAVVVMAAGNDGEQMSQSKWFTPASYAREIGGALAVGSISSNGSKSGFSNYSTTYVDLAAPGANVLSTLMSGGYGPMSGTSMSTPIVAGAAGLAIGLLKARDVPVTPALVEQMIHEGSVEDDDIRSYFADGRRLNLRKLAQTIETKFSPGRPLPSPEPTARPTATPSPTPTPTPVPLPPGSTPLPTPAPTPRLGECGTMSPTACQVFRSVNKERASHGLEPLEWSAECTSTAASHSQDMATHGFLSHTSPYKGSFADRARKFGVRGYAGENIAAAYSVSKVVEAWMDSPAHRANLLSRVYRSTGVGVARDTKGMPYYTQCFTSQIPAGADGKAVDGGPEGLRTEAFPP